MHAEEAFRVGDRLGELRDGDGGGVGADDRVRAGGGADPGEGLVFDGDDLGDGFFDVRRGPEVFLEDGSGAFGEQAVGDELVGFGEQALVVLPGDFGGHVRQRNPGPAECQDLGDSAAHVAGADDGDLPGGVDSGRSVRCFRHGQSFSVQSAS